MENTKPKISDYNFDVSPTIVYDKKTLDVIMEKAASERGGKHLLPKKQADESHILKYPSIYDKLKSKGKRSLSGPQDRFKELGKVGEGATANVVAFLDTNTNREVAVKVLKSSDEEVELLSFIKEAHIASSLEHPNIVPLYDLDVDEDGNVCMILKKVTGHSLKKYINTKIQGKEDPYIKSVADIVSLFLKICDALAYAHSQGHIHQDIKPENIMIGKFGQAFLIDWGAGSFSEEYLTVSPPYMSPQQANSCDPEKTDDIYCLGASLYHVLTLRFPTQASSIDELWEKKRQGVIEAPSEFERTTLPSQLMAIVRKALAANVKKRYQAIEEFEQDLKNYQSGLAISAYKYTLWQFMTYFYKQHKHSIKSALLILVLSTAFGLFYYHLKLKEVAYWRTPIFTETFSTADWAQNWQPVIGKWKLEQGRIVTDKGGYAFLFYKTRLEGPVAIEFDAEILPGFPECDLSVVWSPTKTISTDHGEYYFLQNGANENTHSRIYHKKTILSYHDLVLNVGQVYHIRAEIDENHLTLFVDGKQMCRYRSPFPFTGGGFIGLYGYFPGKAFDNVKIYNKGVPQKVDVTAIGDQFFKKKQYLNAVAEYEKVRTSHAGTELAAEATYKEALCLYKLKDTTDKAESLKRRNRALELWRSLKTGYFAMLAKIELIRDAFERGEHQIVLQGLTKLCLNKDSDIRQEAARLWNQMIVQLLKAQSKRRVINQYLLVRDQLFKDDSITHYNAAEALSVLGRKSEIVDKFPNQKHKIAWSLLGQGKYAELLTSYPKLKYPCLDALFHQRRYDDMLNFYPQMKSHSSIRIKLAKGDFKAILKEYKDKPHLCATALLWLGKYDELQKRYPNYTSSILMSYLLQNKPEKVLAKTHEGALIYHQAEYLQAINEFIDGKHKSALQKLQNLDKKFQERTLPSSWFDLFVEPYLLFLYNKNKSDLVKSLEYIIKTRRYKQYQNQWYLASFLIGNMDKATFMKKPDKQKIESQALFAEAMKAEFNDNLSLALAKYKQYQHLPAKDKELNPIIKRLVNWRIKMLSKSK